MRHTQVLRHRFSFVPNLPQLRILRPTCAGALAAADMSGLVPEAIDPAGQLAGFFLASPLAVPLDLRILSIQILGGTLPMLLLLCSLILLLAVLAGRSVSILLRIILIAIMAGCFGVLFPWITHCPLPAAVQWQPNVILKLESCGEA